jgi:structural maintenance of chromosome 3 (chondroitin sulfate proteoglycan 6)
VEVTAGNQLFSVVVDTDETASKCISYINRKKIDARLTFLPLNRLRQKPHNLPDGDDAIHLWKKVSCDERLMPAVYHVFGRTLICRDLAVCAAYSNRHEVDTVTLDGDKVGRKGAMTGGYLDQQVSKLEMAAKLRECSKKFQAVNDEAEKMKKVHA